MAEFIMLTVFILLAVISPGPDFVIVTKNALSYGKNVGIYAAIGVSCGAMILATASILGLTVIIIQSVLLFNILKLIGAAYLIYLGLKSLMSRGETRLANESSDQSSFSITKFAAFKDGLMCSSLNPKAMLFFTALFTIIIENKNGFMLKIAYGIEVTTLYLIWFIVLCYLITHPSIKSVLDKVQCYVNKVLGILLVLLGIHVITIIHFSVF